MVDRMLEQLGFQDFRLKSFQNSVFEKQTKNKCNSQKMAAAGFFFAPTETERDLVKCYACGLEMFGWNRNEDPWTEHAKENPHCFYLASKKSYAHELTVMDFLQIERARYMRINDDLFNQREASVSKFIEHLREQESQ